MPTKSKSTKRRTKVREISRGSKPLSKAEQKKVKGGGDTLVIYLATGEANSDTPIGIKAKVPR